RFGIPHPAAPPPRAEPRPDTGISSSYEVRLRNRTGLGRRAVSNGIAPLPVRRSSLLADPPSFRFGRKRSRHRERPDRSLRSRDERDTQSACQSLAGPKLREIFQRIAASPSLSPVVRETRSMRSQSQPPSVIPTISLCTAIRKQSRSEDVSGDAFPGLQV